MSRPALVFDFETQEQMRHWQMLGAGAVERSDERAFSGRWSARIQLDPWKEGEPSGPDTPELGDLSKWSFAQLSYPAPFDNWTFWGAWRARMYAVGESRCYHEILDESGAKWWRPIRLERDRWVTVEIPLTGGIDFANVARQWFYRAEGEPASTIFIDDIELVRPGPGWLEGVQERLPETPEGSAAHEAAAESIARVRELADAAREGYADETLTVAEATRISEEMQRQARAAHARARHAEAQGMLGLARVLQPDARFGVGLLSSMVRPCVRDRCFGVDLRRGWHMRLARGERESFQVIVVRPDARLRGVAVRLGELRADDGEVLPGDASGVRTVGSFLLGRPGYYQATYEGWHADVLLPHDEPLTVPAGDFQGFWVTVHAPRDQRPGVYRGAVTVSARNAPPVELPLTVTVREFDLPRRPSMQTALSFNDGAVDAVYGGHDLQRIRRFHRFLLDYWIEPTDIYRKTPPDLDYMEMLGEQYWPTRFNIMQISRWPLTLSPEERKPHVDFLLDSVRRVVPELRERGLMERAYIYGYDEARVCDEMLEVLKPLQEEFPDLEIITTAHDPSYGADTILGDYVDSFVPAQMRYDHRAAEAARARGHDVWWYFYVGQQHPFINWFLQYPLIEVRVLFGPMAAKYRPDGILYWTINAWTSGGIEEPLSGGPLFPQIAPGFKGDHGEGILLYPGADGPLASMRLENVRDGLEDYEYYLLLERLVSEAEATPTDRLTHARIEAAEALLAVNSRVVRDLDEFTRDPGLLRRERERVADAIEQLTRIAGQT
ncbi:MAG: glycoside hydrolase domain-containing protein [Armatimonadota bacterium]